MILRVFRGAVASGKRDRVLTHLRDSVYPSLARIDGLRSFQAGLRTRADGGLQFAVVTTWEDFERLAGSIGPDLDRPRPLDGIADAYEPQGADHFELVGEQIQGVFPLEGGILRVFHGRLTGAGTESFFDFARRRQTELLDEGMIVASHIGRRIVGTAEEAIYVVLWRDADAIRQLGGDVDRPAAPTEWASYFEHWDLEAYDALTRVRPRAGSGPALLLADDERRYLFATGPAAQLVGRPVGRIVGRRIEDVTGPADVDHVERLWQEFVAAGTLEGAIELSRGDGTPTRVRFAARANTPWPGCHTSLLVPEGEEVGLDAIDEALSEAGIMVRYPVASG